MAIDNKKFQIRIESILGGHSPSAYYSSQDQFQASIGIDPSWPATDGTDGRSSGLIRPMPSNDITSGSLPTSPIKWIRPSAKDQYVLYMYAQSGSAYTFTTGAIAALSDGGSLSASTGNGLEYYDNYMYFAKNTTIARYGPLDGTPAFNGDYWVTTLGKAALTNTTYVGVYPSNHIMKRHSDGKLYIADVQNNQGVLHVISTTKTTVEGDTDNGSTFQKLTFGYGLYPVAIESYGSSIVIALVETNAGANSSAAKLAFWDTTSQNFNSIIWSEFPDGIITGLKNVNGTLYIISNKQQSTNGFRVSRYIGGSSVEEVAYITGSYAPSQGAIDGSSTRLLFGVKTITPEISLSVLSYNLQNSKVGRGLFNVLNANGVVTDGDVTAIWAGLPSTFGAESIVAATTDSFGIETIRNNYGARNYTVWSNWWSAIYKIGQPFKITKIRIPLAQTIISTSSTITPTIYIDDGTTTKALAAINSTNFLNKKNIVIRPENLTGDHNFWLELRWTHPGSNTINTVALPIVIEYELIDD